MREIDRNCAIAIKCTGEAGLGNGSHSRNVTISMLGHSNGTARHANTHKRRRRPYPGSHAGRGCECTGLQFKPQGPISGPISATKSSAEFGPSATRYQFFAEPNTCAIDGAFTGAGDQRTGLSAAPRGARGAWRAAFRLRIAVRPLRFPSPVGPAATTPKAAGGGTIQVK